MKPQPLRIQDIQSLLNGGFSDEQIASFTGATWLAILAERGKAAASPRPPEAQEIGGLEGDSNKRPSFLPPDL